MLVLSEQDIQKNYFMIDAIADIKQALISKNKGFIHNPHRTVIDIPTYQASALYMPSADLAEEITVVKVVSIFPENPERGKPTTQAVMLLTNAQTGEHIGMMNASYLTRLRTGALSGIATEKLARLDSKTLGVIGTGAMAFEQVLGVLEVREIETIMLFNRTYEKAEQFKEKLIEHGVQKEVAVVQTVDELVQQADIICCSTRSHSPVFNGHKLNEGTHINGVGSFLPTMREVDLTTIQRADKIVVDDLEGVQAEAGELIHASEESNWNFSDIHAELSHLSEGDHLVRETEEEITFFKSVGAAYFDLAVAKGVYLKARNLGIGSKVDL